MAEMQKRFAEYKKKLVELEQREAKRNQAEEIINVLTKNPESLKLLAQTLSKFGLVDKVMKI